MFGLNFYTHGHVIYVGKLFMVRWHRLLHQMKYAWIVLEGGIELVYFSTSRNAVYGVAFLLISTWW